MECRARHPRLDKRTIAEVRKFLKKDNAAKSSLYTVRVIQAGALSGWFIMLRLMMAAASLCFAFGSAHGGPALGSAVSKTSLLVLAQVDTRAWEWGGPGGPTPLPSANDCRQDGAQSDSIECARYREKKAAQQRGPERPVAKPPWPPSQKKQAASRSAPRRKLYLGQRRQQLKRWRRRAPALLRYRQRP